MLNKNGFIYKLREVPKILDQDIEKLVSCGELIWINRYGEKFKQRIEKGKKILSNNSNINS